MDNTDVKEKWNARYESDTYVYGTVANDFLRRSAYHIPKGNVLCLGEGEGRNAVFLAGQGYHVTAIDISDAGLRKARTLAEQKGVHINTVTSDLADYNFGNQQWEGIVSIFCHIPSELRRVIHQRVIDGLAPGGVYILESYTPEQLKYKTGGPPTPDLLVSLPELREELKTLQLLHAVERLRSVHEGTLHSGKAAVVQVIAQKAF